ncbi:hypothetical protein [Propionivibrio dicarboxylicus]|uniref:Uncharacterized protein n=1 Tax=Propionivibrio dicarboxylicus TaxID=83767 RepID=A0A1G8C936_9RHOO|nr:hypothetical protein [Propionivibrio dicarboxylicus]SDH41882.1 hypothetical protein SAMN05660652_01707 [Propionivibrio dicarboxylicus]
MTTTQPKPCDFLPPDAREALIAASKIPQPIARRIAMQEATERAQRKYPQFFQSAKEQSK